MICPGCHEEARGTGNLCEACYAFGQWAEKVAEQLGIAIQNLLRPAFRAGYVKGQVVALEQARRTMSDPIPNPPGTENLLVFPTKENDGDGETS